MLFLAMCNNLHGRCLAVQENGVDANRVSILTRTTKLRFSHIHSSLMPNPNGTKFTVEIAFIQGTQDFKFEEPPLAIREI